MVNAHYLRFTILLFLDMQLRNVKYFHIVVQSSPHPFPELSYHPKFELISIK